MFGFAIQSDLWENQEQIISVLNSKNIPFVLHPLSDLDLSFCKNLNVPEIFCYGSLEWIAQIQYCSDKRLKTLCSIDNFDCRNYYPHFQQFLFNKTHVYIQLRELIALSYDLLKEYGGQIFVRPSTGTKPNGISGTIFNKQNFAENISYFNVLNPDDWLVIDEVKHIDYEYRTIIYNNKLITGCQYRSYDKETKKLGFDPTSDFPDKIKNKVEQIISSKYWQPDEIYVLDMVESNSEISIMELNALSTSGWYDCDVEKIIESIQNSF